MNIIGFIIVNKNSIRIKDLKIIESFYKYYRNKGNCIICNSLSNNQMITMKFDYVITNGNNMK